MSAHLVISFLRQAREGAYQILERIVQINRGPECFDQRIG